jgi:hypothetical protein
MGAACVAMRRHPLASVVIALLLTSAAGLAVAPLIIVAGTVSYIASEVLSARRVPAVHPIPRRVSASRLCPGASNSPGVDHANHVARPPAVVARIERHPKWLVRVDEDPGIVGPAPRVTMCSRGGTTDGRSATRNRRVPG